jgi:hypothetical protein
MIHQNLNCAALRINPYSRQVWFTQRTTVGCSFQTEWKSSVISWRMYRSPPPLEKCIGNIVNGARLAQCMTAFASSSTCFLHYGLRSFFPASPPDWRTRTARTPLDASMGLRGAYLPLGCMRGASPGDPRRNTRSHGRPALRPRHSAIRIDRTKRLDSHSYDDR